MLLITAIERSIYKDFIAGLTTVLTFLVFVRWSSGCPKKNEKTNALNPNINNFLKCASFFENSTDSESLQLVDFRVLFG